MTGSSASVRCRSVGQDPEVPVLTRANRLTSSQEFSRAVRRGGRAGARTLVLHLDFAPVDHTDVTVADRGPRVGFVVSKAVGNAATRNQVKRRLRHLARERLTSLPGSAVLVVRALPTAADATSVELGGDLDSALGRVLRRRRGHGVRAAGPKAVRA